jgi:serine/threonine-protein kinase
MEQTAIEDPLIGVQVGNYEVRRKLGEGGMGSVYLAEHPLIGKKVALKVLHAEFASNEDVVGRFFNEAKAVNDIQHPNIVDIIDYGVIPQSTAEAMVYFIMEFLAGRSLADVVRNEAPLAPERALRICVQIADALSASHRSNIVHRDLKPDNVILIRRRHEVDFVKVLDFGIAKLTGDQPNSRRTRTGVVMGTPAYMSPEQCEGRGEVDHRTDVYALGILLYEMITGKVPFEGDGYGEVLVKHLTQIPAKPSTIRGVIPPHIEAVCLRALEKRPDDRYPSMDEFMRALTDPVSYVEGAGGLQHFTTANLGAPHATPYPPPHTPLTPLPGTLSPATGMPMQTPGHGMPAPQHQVSPPTPLPQPNPNQAAWPSPVPGANTVNPTGGQSKLPLIVVGALALIGIVVGAAVVFGGGDDKVAQNVDAAVPAVMDAALVPDAAVATNTVPDAAPIPDATPKPVIIKHEITSSPSGAYVYRDGKRVGKTPYTLEVEQGVEAIDLELKRRGHEDEKKSIKSIAGTTHVKLKKKRGGGIRPGTGKPTCNKFRPDGTINPFCP